MWKAMDQTFLLGYLRNISKSDKSSPLYGLLSSKAAAAGHSEGGAASFISGAPFLLNYAYPYQFDSIVVFSGCFASDYAELERAVSNSTIPIFFITGTHDCLCSPEEWDFPLYQASTSTCKYFANIVNGGHCEFAWPGFVDWICDFVVDINGCIFEDILDHTTQQTITMRYMVPYLNWQLKGMQSEKAKLDSALQNDVKQKVVETSIKC